MKSFVELLNLINQRQDQIAWNQLVEKSSPDLYRYVSYLVYEKSDADDLLQDTYLALLENIQSVYEECAKKNTEEEVSNKKFYAWLYKTARNKTINLNKRSHMIKSKNQKLSNEEFKNNYEDASEFLEKEEKFIQLKNEISQLKENQQRILILKFYQGVSNLEIAKELNYDLSSVPILVSRALAVLKRRLEKVGIIVTIAVLSETLADRAMASEMPASLLPEVFHCLKVAKINVAQAITLKGILMKSIYAILFTVIIVFIIFETNIIGKEKETLKKSSQLVVKNKPTTKPLGLENQIIEEELPSAPIGEVVENLEVNNNTTTVIKEYFLPESKLSFEIQSIKKLVDDFRISPYFKITNSPGTSSDYNKLQWKNIFDIYNEILGWKLESEAFKLLFTCLEKAAYFRYDSDCNKKFQIKLTYDDEKSCEENYQKILVYLKSDEEKFQKTVVEDNEAVEKEKLNGNQLTISHPNRISVELKKELNTIYFYNGSIEGKQKSISSKSNSNVIISLIFESLKQKYGYADISKVFDFFGVDKNQEILIGLDLTVSGVQENIDFHPNNSPQLFSSNNIDLSIFKGIQIENISNVFLINLNPKEILNGTQALIPILGLDTENIKTQITQLNVLTMMATGKNLDSFIESALNGKVYYFTLNGKDNLLVGIQNMALVKSVIKAAQNLGIDFSILEFIEDKYLKIEWPTLISGTNPSSKNLASIDSQNKYYSINYFAQEVFFLPISESFKSLAYQYKSLNPSIENAIPFLENKLVLSYFKGSKIEFKREKEYCRLEISHLIPFLFGNILNLELESPEIKNDNSNSKSTVVWTEARGRKYKLDYSNMTFEYLDQDEKVLFHSELKNEKPFGKAIGYYEDGNKRVEYQIIDDNLMDGLYQKYDIKQNLIVNGNYNKGSKVGDWEYYENNELYKTISYDEKGKPKSGYEEKFRQGKNTTIFHLDSNGNGIVKVSNPSGIILLEGSYKLYKKTGAWKTFFETSKLSMEWEYDVLNNIHSTSLYDKSGHKIFSVPFKNGMINGIVEEYTTTGKLKGSYNFLNNRGMPAWLVYSEQGILIGEWQKGGEKLGAIKKVDYKMGEWTISDKSILDGNVIFNKFVNGIEQILSLHNSIISDNGSTVLRSFGDLLDAYSSFKGMNTAAISVVGFYPLTLNELKETLQFKMNSWNNELNEFINYDKSENDRYILDSGIVYRLLVEKDIVIKESFIGFDTDFF